MHGRTSRRWSSWRRTRAAQLGSQPPAACGHVVAIAAAMRFAVPYVTRFSERHARPLAAPFMGLIVTNGALAGIVPGHRWEARSLPRAAAVLVVAAFVGYAVGRGVGPADFVGRGGEWLNAGI